MRMSLIFLEPMDEFEFCSGGNTGAESFMSSEGTERGKSIACRSGRSFTPATIEARLAIDATFSGSFRKTSMNGRVLMCVSEAKSNWTRTIMAEMWLRIGWAAEIRSSIRLLSIAKRSTSLQFSHIQGNGNMAPWTSRSGKGLASRC